MKLTCESLRHLELFPGPGDDLENPIVKYFDDIDNWTKCKGPVKLSDKPCLNCGMYYLKEKYKNPNLSETPTNTFCDSMCKKEYIKKTTKPKIKLPDKRLKENGGGRHRKNKASWNKGTAIQKGLTIYKTYADKISWFTKVRKNHNDERVLDTVCCICGKWFSPKSYRVRDIIKYLNGNMEKSFWGFYCSKVCENNCPYFGKAINTIIRYDYLNNGKAKYSEIHSISDSVLYYDWQEVLKKQLEPKKESYKKRKMRRRKKREGELKRIRIKKEKKLKRNQYLNSKDSAKDQRLKRLLYLSKHRAKNKGWEHDIDYEWIVENVSSVCPKCGIEFSYDMLIKMNPFAPSIDRLDSNKGYTKDNCTITSWIYNCGKNSYTEKDLYIICKAYLNNTL